MIICNSLNGKLMYKLTLGLLTFAFIFSLNLASAQVKTDSSLVKNPVVTKSIDKKKVDVTKSVNTKKNDVTKPINEKKIDVTKSMNTKKINVTKPTVTTKQLKPKKYNYTDSTLKREHKLKPIGGSESNINNTPIPVEVKPMKKTEYKSISPEPPGGEPFNAIPLVTKGTGTPINTKCIVSGEDVDSKITADYKGTTYAFCCKTCLKKFTADPEKYVSKLDKETSKSIN